MASSHPQSKQHHNFGATLVLPGQQRTLPLDPIKCTDCRVPIALIADGLLSHERSCRHHPDNCQVDLQELRERARKEAASIREAAARNNQQMTIPVQPLGCGHPTFSLAIDNAPPGHVRFLTGKCPACASDDLPRLLKIVREAA